VETRESGGGAGEKRGRLFVGSFFCRVSGLFLLFFLFYIFICIVAFNGGGVHSKQIPFFYY